MSMISVVMPVYNRPQYLSCVLEALAMCENISECTVITSEEPYDCTIGDLFRVFSATKVVRNLNTSRLGCNKNIYTAIERGFEYNDQVIILEDDIVPTRDFINYFIWAFKNYKDKENVLGVSAYRMRKEKIPGKFLDKVVEKDAFTAWGWGLWKDSWNKIKKEEVEIFFGDPHISWDYLLFNKFIKELKYNFILPIIGRTQNIGEIGTFVPNPQWQRENQYTPYNADSYDKTIINFKEIKNDY